MRSVPIECPRCKGRMEAGLLTDKFDRLQYSEQEWMEGEATKSFWHGLELKGRRRMKVTSHRCEACGFLESYANEHVEE